MPNENDARVMQRNAGDCEGLPGGFKTWAALSRLMGNKFALLLRTI
ncbi:hypothetical protein [Gilvimarinus japonicus]|uniref:Uncharacterized protein n=1 Tax=Gilvimarinus japonicus TaxID=1796469 RepID=A0ABV7HUD5_9GAMM